MNRRREHDKSVVKRPPPHPQRPEDPVAAWNTWVADNMQQRERGLSPYDDSRPSALILVPLLGLPALLVIGLLLVLLLG